MVGCEKGPRGGCANPGGPGAGPLDRTLRSGHSSVFAGGPCDADLADEMFQEFALRLVRGDFRNADAARGRFRFFLKTALYHLVVDAQRLPAPRTRPSAFRYRPACQGSHVRGSGRPVRRSLARRSAGAAPGMRCSRAMRKAGIFISCSAIAATIPTCARRTWPSSLPRSSARPSHRNGSASACTWHASALPICCCKKWRHPDRADQGATGRRAARSGLAQLLPVRPGALAKPLNSQAIPRSRYNF